ncbi:MAG: nucleotide exchange factor GrpE [Deltaproteobacteria bacterium]|nr:nucleotide exchange factor GrpE [Deltaproteobacteria bacterium]
MTSGDDSDKGSFSVDIGEDAIAAALRSVERAKGADSSEEVAILKAQLEDGLARGREWMEKARDAQEKLKVASAEAADSKDRALRAAADLENFKKRAQKEREDVQKFGSEKLLKEFLPVLDNLDRALAHANSPADFDSLREGLTMTRKLFEDALGKHGVKGFSAQGQPFDPHRHEAMQQVETAEVPPNTVVTEVVRGYTLNDRLIRPALVAVSRVPAGA